MLYYRRRMICYILLSILFVQSHAAIAPKETSVYQKLNDYIFTDYNKQARPVFSPNTPINVTFGIEMVQFISVDDRNQIVTSKIWVRQKWKNLLIKWNPADWGGIKELQVEGDMVWSPDIVLYNNADENFPGSPEKYRTRITLSYDGSNQWLAPAIFTSTCAIDIRYFPFDQQKCHFKFGSWTFPKSGITLIKDNRPLITTQFINSSEWQITESIGEVNEILYNCCPDPYMDATFRFTLLRKPLYYVFNVILPCVVLVSTILFGFFLPPESGERISLTITILLAVAVFLQLISDTLPRNSDSIPILGMFYMVVMAESALSLVTTCVVLIIHHQSGNKKPISRWVRNLFLKKIAKILGVKVIYLDEKDISQNSGFQNGGFAPEKHDNISLKKETVADFDHDYKFELEKVLDNKIRMRKTHLEATDEITTMDAILNEVQIIASSIEYKQKAEEIEAEWRCLAKVLDRIFFWLFLITVLVSSLCILLPAKEMYH